MAYKFERLEVWQRALEYADLVYAVADALPRSEDFNVKSQLTRAANSIALNVAEGSTSQTDAEQARFIGIALRSLIETVACLHLIKRRGYLEDPTPLREAYRFSESLFAPTTSIPQSPKRIPESVPRNTHALRSRHPSPHVAAVRRPRSAVLLP